jgi:multidrug resistance efflux pump
MQLENNLRMAENDLDRATMELRRLRQSEQFMNLTSPGTGLVGSWTVRNAQFVRAGDLLGTLELDAPRQVRGWLDDRMAGTLQVGMEARVRIRNDGLDRLHTGRIVSVMAGADPASPDEFGMLVTIAIFGLSAAETRVAFPFNSPVEVSVQRNVLRAWFGWGR